MQDPKTRQKIAIWAPSHNFGHHVGHWPTFLVDTVSDWMLTITCYGILLQQVRIVILCIVRRGYCEYLFVSELHHVTRQKANIISTIILAAESCMRFWVLHGSLLHPVLEHGDLSNAYISQGSLEMRLRCGRIFNNHFTANLMASLSVKEFRKLVQIWRTYHREFGIFFFDSRWTFTCP